MRALPADLYNELLEYFEAREDVRDTSDGPAPNAAMNFVTRLKELQAGLPPIDEAELATLMAALYHYEMTGQGDPEMRTDEVHELAAPGHVMSSLDAAGISALQEKLMRSTGQKLCQCDNCQFVCPEGWLIEDIKDLEQRLDHPIGHPDCIEPAGECPVCQCLSYAEDTPRRDGSTREVKP